MAQSSAGKTLVISQIIIYARFEIRKWHITLDTIETLIVFKTAKHNQHVLSMSENWVMSLELISRVNLNELSGEVKLSLEISWHI